MAANDYYGSHPANDAYSRPTPAPYSSAYDNAYDNTYEPSLASTPSTKPPTYVSHQPTPAPSHTHQPPPPTQSPFDTDFDDHVYPMNSNQGGQNAAFAQDTRYQGSNSGNVSPMTGDDIPLRDNNKPGPDGSPSGVGDDDQVYDVERRPKRRPQNQRGFSKRGRGLYFGEMGMIGANNKSIPVMTYLFSIIQIGVFIGELVKAANLTGSPIQTKPSFNPMIGPSPQVTINMGARFVSCMREQNVTQQNGNWVCPNATSADTTSEQYTCSLSELCGFGGVGDPPDQWFRFIVPIFLHAGIIHIGFNLLMQLTMGKEIERAIGSIRFFLVYMSAGIFGFVMGGNYAAPGIASTGASGSLFGIIAISLLDLLYSWGDRRSPIRELLFVIVAILISLALGLLPGLDNFSHIGGFIVGLGMGISVLHSPNFLRRRIGEDHFGGGAYSELSNTGITSVAFPPFHRNPVGFFKGRKSLWWAWWLIRAGFLVLVIVVFIVLISNFYAKSANCEWCKYLSCLVCISCEI